MKKIIEIPSNASMVNYTNVLTSVPNEIYVTETQTPDSFASLIKNNIIIQFTLTPEVQDNKKEEKITTSVSVF